MLTTAPVQIVYIVHMAYKNITNQATTNTSLI